MTAFVVRPWLTMNDVSIDRSKEYGLVYKIHMLGLGTWLIIADPDLVHRVYVTYVLIIANRVRHVRHRDPSDL